MAMKSRTWECPDCEGHFTTVMDDRDGPPRFCQLCGSDMSADTQPIPNFSRISRAQNKTLDRTYRQMEAASYARAEQAADMMGVPVSEMSNIKMTDMKDNLREGDTSFVAPRPTIPQPMPMAAPSQGFATAQMIRQQGGSVGHSVMDKLKTTHSQRAVQVRQAGELGRYAG